MVKNVFQRRLFWKDFAEEYFDLTHLHGFKELSLSSSKWEKIAWMLIIIGAITFTGYLISRSIKESLEDKIQTNIDYEKFGNISLPVLYCPNDWVDLYKIKNANIPEHFVFYSLTYLRTEISMYLDETFFNHVYGTNISSFFFCNEKNINSQVTLPELVFFAPFILSKCIDGRDPPEYFGNRSKSLLNSVFNMTEIVETSNATLMGYLFEQCQNNNINEVWHVLYYQFHLSDTSSDYLNDPEDNVAIEDNEDNYINTINLTLCDLDNLHNESHISCGIQAMQPKTESENQLDFCSMYMDASIFYMFHGDKLQYFFCPYDTSDCHLLARVEKRRSSKIVEIISEYLNRTVSYESFSNFIKNDIGGSSTNQNKKLQELSNYVFDEFKEREKEGFMVYMKDNNLTVFDIFRIISFDENNFLLSLSVDPDIVIHPRNGNITASKVINAFGVCYLFEIEADTRPISYAPVYFPISQNEMDVNIDGHISGQTNEKIFINIVELKRNGFLLIWDESFPNILVIGSESKNLIPRGNSYDLNVSDYGNVDNNWRNAYYLFKVSNLAYYSEKRLGNCQENMKNDFGFTYTYSNCLTDCFNNYSQPKFFFKTPNKQYICQYITEGMSNTFDGNFCSFFSNASTEIVSDDAKSEQENIMDECNDRCKKDCEVLTFDIAYSKVKCDEETYKCFMPTGFIINNDSKAWNKSKSMDIAKLRISLEINSDVTRSVTTQSVEWYTYLANVGGQINLVISGSVLSVFQLLWWCLQYFFRYNRMPRPSTIRNQHLAVMVETTL